VYTHPESGIQMLNIIHCHLNDMGEDATLEVVHMQPRASHEKPAELV